MLGFFPTGDSNCQRRSRRRFLVEIGSLAPLGLSLPMALRARAARGAAASGDISCILVWCRGGVSHHDTFDPKPKAPAAVRGEFGVTSTAVPGVQFSDQIPKLAQALPRYTLLRGLNPQNASHGVADALMLSGHKFNATLTFPCYGSVVAKELGPKTVMPPFVQIGTQVDRTFSGGLAGILGLEYNAFELPGDPNNKNFKVRDVSPYGGMKLDRIERRRHALETLDRFQRDVEKRPDALAAMDSYYESAFSMITSQSTQAAFDLSQEDDKMRDRYGRTTFGQSCLLARRLIQAGVRFVTVTSGGWDTHQNNFAALKRLLPPVDQGFPALLEDLEEQGMLDSTLVVWLTDFGRTPKINSASGRDHWATASMAVFAGAGVPGGQVVGATDDEGAKPVAGEYFPKDVAATIYRKLGIPLDTIHHAPDGRPVLLCEGTPIPELFG